VFLVPRCAGGKTHRRGCADAVSSGSAERGSARRGEDRRENRGSAAPLA
jgi:hypothetical protein